METFHHAVRFPTIIRTDPVLTPPWNCRTPFSILRASLFFSLRFEWLSPWIRRVGEGWDGQIWIGPPRCISVVVVMEAGSTWHTCSAVVKETCSVSKRSGDLWLMCFFSAGYFIYDFFDMLLNQKLSQSWELLFHHVVVSQIFTSDPGWEAHHSAEHTCGRRRHGEDKSVRPRNKELERRKGKQSFQSAFWHLPTHHPHPPTHPQS